MKEILVIVILFVGFFSEGHYFISAKSQKICGSILIYKDISHFEKLRDCTVIEGNLVISWMKVYSRELLEKLTFPNLVEITDYLLLFNLKKIQRLTNMFPNLELIRGQELWLGYALFIHDLPDLREIAFPSLVKILNGAVYLRYVDNLCLNNINWKLMERDTQVNDDFIELKPQCMSMCHKSCPSVGNSTTRRCWTYDICQKVPCPKCNNKMCTDDGQCCHDYCLGGCTGPRHTDCVTCKNVLVNGSCQRHCTSTYMYRNRRCVTASECLSKDKKHFLINRAVGNDLCALECPAGYRIDESRQGWCVKCDLKCPRVCEGRTVTNARDVRELHFCTYIKGPLVIEIDSTSNDSVSKELETNLAHIEEIEHSLIVMNSYPIITLHFLKNLRVIHGKVLKSGKYSLFIYNNHNLQELFSNETAKRLKIINGHVFFDYNHKLCFDKIELFLNFSLNNSNILVNKRDISHLNNGDRAQCQIKEIEWISAKAYKHKGDDSDPAKSQTHIVLKWKRFRVPDYRSHLGYFIYYRAMSSDTATTEIDGKDACNSEWSVKEVYIKQPSTNDEQAALTFLDPFTYYQIYIETTMLSSSKIGGRSSSITIRTVNTKPTEPRNLKLVASTTSTLMISWLPPLKENGHVRYYEIYWNKKDPPQKDYLMNINSCVNEVKDDLNMFLAKYSEVESEKNATDDNKEVCCSCKKSTQRKNRAKEELERDEAIQFENALHNAVYKPRVKRGFAYTNIGGENISCSNKYARKVTYNTARTFTTQFPDKSTIRVTLSKENVSLSNHMNSTEQPSTQSRQFIVPLQSELFNKTVVFMATNWTLTNLEYFTFYTIKVRACQEQGNHTNESYCSDPTYLTVPTKPSPRADIIRSTSHKIMPNNSVRIGWQEPLKPNGLVLRYHLQIWRVDQNLSLKEVCVSHFNFTNSKSHIIQNLQPGEYSYRIKAYTFLKFGPWSKERVFSIVSAGNPLDLAIAFLSCGVLVVIISVSIALYFVRRKFAVNREQIISSFNPEYMLTEVYIPDEWEVDRNDIIFTRELGQGSFGMVYEGIYKTIGQEDCRVAVKTLNENADYFSRVNFLKEASHMKQLVCHHVVHLIGLVSKTQPTYVIMELMMNGDLKNFLRNHRPDGSEPGSVSRPLISCKQVLQMSGEIADGMAYLSSKKFIHRDLAARNCMVHQDMTVKIGDFGMTRDIYETDYYRKGGKDLLPVRWMAPESLKDGVYTSKSDVWSFGVVLWEMATLAAQPYQGLSNEQVLKYIISGQTMECPSGCPQRLWEMMSSCWAYSESNRPTFLNIIDLLLSDLHPSFEKVSFYFSNENKGNGDIDDEDFPYDDEYGGERGMILVQDDDRMHSDKERFKQRDEMGSNRSSLDNTAYGTSHGDHGGFSCDLRNDLEGGSLLRHQSSSEGTLLKSTDPSVISGDFTVDNKPAFFLPVEDQDDVKIPPIAWQESNESSKESTKSTEDSSPMNNGLRNGFTSPLYSPQR